MSLAYVYFEEPGRRAGGETDDARGGAADFRQHRQAAGAVRCQIATRAKFRVGSNRWRRASC
jgi:hypothetical protein